MRTKKGFTLIELLVTIMIIGILVAIATFGVRQAQQSARDARRKADLEDIALGLELYRAECNSYPDSISFGGSLTGSGNPTACTGTYIATIPQDPSPPRTYSYSRINPGSIVLCANLEQDPNPPGSTTNCGSCGGSGSCDWRIARP